MRELSYNRMDAVNYARKWALNRNPAYYNFQEIGGDCTNFASQCIYAGSKIMNYTPTLGWYYNSPYDRTPSWSGVEYLYNFLTSNKSVGPYARVVTMAEAKPGDIVQLGTSSDNFYHSPVITATSPVILVAAHTYDALDKPLSDYLFEQVRYLHIVGVRTW